MNSDIFQIWKPQVSNEINITKKLKTINLNFGPQHPAAHGVLRLILELDGELIEKTDLHIGLLHRGTEKLIETKPYLHSLPYFDRFDYVSMLVQEHAYCLAVEELLNTTNYNSTFTSIRTLFDELTRVLNHMLAIGCHALDVGSMSALFWSFEEREKIMEFYERVSGARMHAAFYRPNELNVHILNNYLLDDIIEFCRNCFTTLNEMHNILTYNKIWKQRLINIGTYNTQTCLSYGLTGVMARCVGFQRDIRLSKLETYSNYYYLNFRSFLGNNGDSYDRFLIRMNEMTESLSIIIQVINNLFTISNLNYLTVVDYKYEEHAFFENFDYISNKDVEYKATSWNYIERMERYIDIIKKTYLNSLDEDSCFKLFIDNQLEYRDREIKEWSKLLDLYKQFNINELLISKENYKYLEDNYINVYNLLKHLDIKNYSYSNKYSAYNTMEETINHFKYWSEGFKVKTGFTYKAVESPKGEFGVFLVSDESNLPYRCKVRSPAYHHLQVLPQLSKGHFLADLATLIGTVDIVFGEIDR